MKPSLYVAIALLVSVPALAWGTTFTTNNHIPVNVAVFVGCAVGGDVAMVALTGTLHILNVVTIDGAGIHLQEHFNPTGITGTGLTTGDKFQGTGITRSSFLMTPAGTIEVTFINRFNIVGTGRAPSFIVRETEHTTVLADGTATTTVSTFTMECK